MGGVKGKLVTCDRCGAETFLKYIGKGDTDGGYTTWDKFEELSDDWMYGSQFGYLCPDCANEFKTIMYNFLGDILCKSWRPDYAKQMKGE